MKKLLALILVMLTLLLLIACNYETSLDNNLSQNQTNNSNESNTIQNQTNEESKDNNKNAITFTELVAVNNSECTIKITGIDPDNLWGYTLKVQLENKSGDKTYMFSVDNASINGVQCEQFFATEVAAGKKSNDNISFSSSELEENGINEFTDIELTFRVYDSNDWLADAVATETIHIYPYGEDKAVKFIRESQTNDTVIVDNEYVSVIVTGYEDDVIWGYTVKLFILNKTDKNIMISIDEVSVNGYMADPFFAKSVSSEKCAFSSISWSDDTLKDNGINNVEKIEFILRVYDEDNWFGGDFVNEAITLTP